MRTDPRAEEVRQIVERVFCGYLRHWAAVAGPSRGGSRGLDEFEAADRREWKSERALAVANVGAGEVHADFPRLYDPAGLREEGVRGKGSRDGRATAEMLEIDETVLIDEGRYVARSYRVEGYLAMWLVGVGIVQFYDDRGRMLATINLFETLRPKRMAA